MGGRGCPSAPWKAAPDPGDEFEAAGKEDRWARRLASNMTDMVENRDGSNSIAAEVIDPR
jgi:hypothetical protein